MTAAQTELISSIKNSILKEDTYLFGPYLDQLKATGVAPTSQVYKILTILKEQTYQSYKQKSLTLPAQYQRKLKALSVLSYFHGCSSFKISKLASLLDLKKEQCLKLLVSVSIYKLVSVKIDQQRNQINILKAKTRERQVTQDITQYNSGKVILIKEKNALIDKNLQRMQKLLEKKPESSIKKKTSGLGMYDEGF